MALTPFRKVETLQPFHLPEPPNSEPQPTPGNTPESMDESVSKFKRDRPKSKANLPRSLVASFVSKIKGHTPNSASNSHLEANDVTEVTKDPVELPELSEIEGFLMDHTVGLTEQQANSDSSGNSTESLVTSVTSLASR